MERKKEGREEQTPNAHAIIASGADRGVTSGDDGSQDGGCQ